MDKQKSIPIHVAIIMDGNGRWAGQKGEERLYGHNHGVEAVRRSVKAAVECGVKYLTLYAFSTENWARPKSEVDGIMEIIYMALLAEIETLDKQGVRVLFIGDKEALSEEMRRVISESEQQTASNERLTLSIALNYSSKAEITSAVKAIAQKVVDNKIKIEDIDQMLISENLYTNRVPDPDLMIRTSGESRLSNFLLWQMAYSELYFTDVMWPEFTIDDFKKAIEVFSQRKRRFGAI